MNTNESNKATNRANSFSALRNELKKAYLQSPVTTSGTVFSTGQISVTRSVKSPIEGKSISISSVYKLSEEASTLVNLNIVNHKSGDLVAANYSPSKTQKVAIRKQEENNYFLEIWKDGVVVDQVKIFGKHKDVCTNGYITIETVQWSADESKVLYMAERKPKEVNIFAEIDSEDDEEEDEKEFNADDYLGANDYKHNWGEAAFKYYNLDVYVYDLVERKLGKVKGIPESLKVLSVQFLGRSGNSLVFTGIDSTTGYPPGLQLCVNKNSAVYTLDRYEVEDVLSTKKNKDKKGKKEKNEAAEQAEDQQGKESGENVKEEKEEPKPKKISEEGDEIALFPIPSPSGAKIGYLFKTKWNDNHLFALGLKIYTPETGSTQLLVKDTDNNDDEVLAMYITTGRGDHKIKWLENEDVVIIPSLQRAGCILNRFKLSDSTRKIYKFKFDFETDVVNILDYVDNLETHQRDESGAQPQKLGLLLRVVNFYRRGLLVYLKDLNACFDEGATPEYIQEALPSPSVSPSQLLKNSLLEEKLEFDDSVTGYLWRLESTEPKSSPTLLYLHGGPHYFTSVRNTEMLNILLKKGYSILTVNFSGSWTFGSDFNDRLAGRIGELDFKEIVGAVEQLRAEDKIGETLDFFGWSYSGFQGVAFLQQYPHLFRRMLIGNPVPNLIYMLYSSDIPDWSHDEALGIPEKFDYAVDLTDEQLLKMKKNSPALLPFDPTSKSEVLFLIGDADLRCAPKANYYLFNKLKKIGLNVKMWDYPNQNHSIPKIDYYYELQLSILNLYLNGFGENDGNQGGEEAQ